MGLDRGGAQTRKAATENGSCARQSLLGLLIVLVALGWSYWVYSQIQIFARWDQAAPADAIGVLGAAEYDGRPSPVYRARLDHALVLYPSRS